MTLISTFLASGWDGDDIYFNVNGERKNTLKNAFNEFEYCGQLDSIDIENDEFQLQSSGDDGVCITSLTVNGSEMLVGKLVKVTFWSILFSLIGKYTYIHST